MLMRRCVRCQLPSNVITSSYVHASNVELYTLCRPSLNVILPHQQPPAAKDAVVQSWSSSCAATTNMATTRMTVTTTAMAMKMKTGKRQYSSLSHMMTTTTISASSNGSHSDLGSFLAHARRTGLSPTSSTYLGTRYEYQALAHLSSNLGFTLSRVGGRGDMGTDLLGTWSLPSYIHPPSPATGQPVDPIKVAIQCKRLASNRRPGPNMVRELEGSFRGAPSAWRAEGAIGMLVCSRPATKGVREAMGRSERGLIWVCLEEAEQAHEERPARDGDDRLISLNSRRRMNNNGNGVHESSEPSDRDGDGDADADAAPDFSYRAPSVKITQLLWNQAASDYGGLEGLAVGLKYSGETTTPAGDLDKEITLLWHGRRLEIERPKSPSTATSGSISRRRVHHE